MLSHARLGDHSHADDVPAAETPPMLAEQITHAVSLPLRLAPGALTVYWAAMMAAIGARSVSPTGGVTVDLTAVLTTLIASSLSLAAASVLKSREIGEARRQAAWEVERAKSEADHARRAADSARKALAAERRKAEDAEKRHNDLLARERARHERRGRGEGE